MTNKKHVNSLHWNVNPISDDVKNSGNKLFCGFNFVPCQQPDAVLKFPISSNHYTLTGGFNAVESSWNVMEHGDAREGKWRGNWRMEWVASTLHTTSEHVVSSINTADAHTSAASSWLNWRPRRFKWTRPFRRKTKSAFCACAITFQT